MINNNDDYLSKELFYLLKIKVYRCTSKSTYPNTDVFDIEDVTL